MTQNTYFGSNDQKWTNFGPKMTTYPAGKVPRPKCPTKMPQIWPFLIIFGLPRPKRNLSRSWSRSDLVEIIANLGYVFDRPRPKMTKMDHFGQKCSIFGHFLAKNLSQMTLAQFWFSSQKVAQVTRDQPPCSHRRVDVSDTFRQKCIIFSDKLRPQEPKSTKSRIRWD